MIVLEDKQTKTKSTPQQIISAAKEAIKNDELLCILNDYDYTVSDITFGDGINPFLTRLYPPTAQALSLMEKKGVVIGAVSNRSGVQVAKRYIDQGIEKPFIVGTYGMELYSLGSSKINQTYEPYGRRITEVSAKVREAFLKLIKLDNSTPLDAEITIDTEFGRIFLENKGLTQSFPQALSQVYNLNLIGIEKRKEIIKVLTKAYHDALTVWEEMSDDNLSKIWGIREFGNYAQKNYSWSVSPLLEEGKLFGVTKLLSSIQKVHKKPIGFVLYGGDEDADAEAMVGLHNIDMLTIRDDNQKLSVFGAWVNPGEERSKVKTASDVEFQGVEGYSVFLNQLVSSLSTF